MSLFAAQVKKNREGDRMSTIRNKFFFGIPKRHLKFLCTFVRVRVIRNSFAKKNKNKENIKQIAWTTTPKMEYVPIGFETSLDFKLRVEISNASQI